MQYAATKEIEAEFVRAVSQANGMSVDGETFRNDLSSGAIPCVTRLVLGLPGRRYDVPVNSIQRIQQPGVRRTYTTVGAILDGVTCVALAYALVRNLPSGKVLP
jgi:hypothetical protein